MSKITKDEVLKLALEALEEHPGNYKLSKAECVKYRAVEDAIREALAQSGSDEEQPAQQDDTDATIIQYHEATIKRLEARIAELEQPAQQGWKLVPVQPTDEMRDAGNVIILDRGALFAAYRAMLNAAPQPAQPAPVAKPHKQQSAERVEPVAWISEVRCVGPEYGKKRYDALPVQSLQPGYYAHTPLYTSPQPSKPLTDKQISKLWRDAHNDTTDRMAFQVLARLVEAAHGIKGDA